MAVAARVREPLHQQQAHTLRGAHTIGRGSERLAAAVPRQTLLPAEPYEDFGRRHDHHAARKRQ